MILHETHTTPTISDDEVLSPRSASQAFQSNTEQVDFRRVLQRGVPPRFSRYPDDRGASPKTLHEETAVCKHTSLSLSDDLPPPHFPDGSPPTVYGAAVGHILVRSERDGLVSIGGDNYTDIQLALPYKWTTNVFK